MVYLLLIYKVVALISSFYDDNEKFFLRIVKSLAKAKLHSSPFGLMITFSASDDDVGMFEQLWQAYKMERKYFIFTFTNIIHQEISGYRIWYEISYYSPKRRYNMASCLSSKRKTKIWYINIYLSFYWIFTTLKKDNK